MMAIARIFPVKAVSVYVLMCLILFVLMVGNHVENQSKRIDRGDMRGGITYGDHR